MDNKLLVNLIKEKSFILQRINSSLNVKRFPTAPRARPNNKVLFSTKNEPKIAFLPIENLLKDTFTAKTEAYTARTEPSVGQYNLLPTPLYYLYKDFKEAIGETVSF